SGCTSFAPAPPRLAETFRPPFGPENPDDVRESRGGRSTSSGNGDRGAAAAPLVARRAALRRRHHRIARSPDDAARRGPAPRRRHAPHRALRLRRPELLRAASPTAPFARNGIAPHVPRPDRSALGHRADAREPPRDRARPRSLSGDPTAAVHHRSAAKRIDVLARHLGGGSWKPRTAPLGDPGAFAAARVVGPRPRRPHRARRSPAAVVLSPRARFPADPPDRAGDARGVRRHPEPQLPELPVLVHLRRAVVSKLAGGAGSDPCVRVPPKVPPAPPVALGRRPLGAEGAAPSTGARCALPRLSRCRRRDDPSRSARGGCFGLEPSFRAAPNVLPRDRRAPDRTGGRRYARAGHRARHSRPRRRRRSERPHPRRPLRRSDGRAARGRATNLPALRHSALRGRFVAHAGLRGVAAEGQVRRARLLARGVRAARGGRARPVPAISRTIRGLAWTRWATCRPPDEPHASRRGGESMSRGLALALGLTSIWASVAGCSESASKQSSMQSTQMAQAAPAPSPTPITSATVAENLVSATAKVKKIDHKTRHVTLQLPDGKETTVK